MARENRVNTIARNQQVDRQNQKALRALADLTAAVRAIAVKLDDDGGTTDTDYEATVEALLTEVVVA